MISRQMPGKEFQPHIFQNVVHKTDSYALLKTRLSYQTIEKATNQMGLTTQDPSHATHNVSRAKATNASL